MSTKKLNDKDIMNLLIDTAIANGATSADCVLSRSRGVSITRRLGKDENIQRYEDFDTGLRVFVGNKISSVSTNENSEQALREVAKRAVEASIIIGELSPRPSAIWTVSIDVSSGKHKNVTSDFANISFL